MSKVCTFQRLKARSLVFATAAVGLATVALACSAGTGGSAPTPSPAPSPVAEAPPVECFQGPVGDTMQANNMGLQVRMTLDDLVEASQAIVLGTVIGSEQANVPQIPHLRPPDCV
jgi:hypothetical protein